jgi:spore coat polysaccharide biosynthesis protein SpsF (cytidylyltransferase family)
MGKVVAIIQARMGSTRLPGKVLLPLGGKPMIVQMVERVKRAALVDEVWVAIPIPDRPTELCDVLVDNGIACMCGSEEDVLDRYYHVANLVGADHIVRLTADCPLIDPNVIDMVIDDSEDFDYCSNVHPETFPDGMDVEVFSFEMLEKAWKVSTEREHVGTAIYNEELCMRRNVECWRELSNYRLTVDYIEDYQAVRTIWDAMPENFTLFHILRYLREHPEVRAINSGHHRNEKTEGK